MSRQFLTPVLLPQDPLQPLEAATKQYVDANSGGGGTGIVLTPNRVVFTNSGTYTKPAGLVYAEVEVQAGGGAGGGAAATAAGQNAFGGGGSGGGYGRSLLDAALIGTTESVTVGAGGVAVVGGVGGNGGDSSFGTLVTATGGTGGGQRGVTTAHANYTSQGAVIGGSASAQWIIPGSPGEFGDVNPASGLACHGGPGGDSALGSAGQMRALTGVGVSGRGFGGGGSGGSNAASQAANAGGAGAPGVVIITEYLQMSAASGITEAAADLRYVNIGGDRMTGILYMDATLVSEVAGGHCVSLRCSAGTAAASENPYLSGYTSDGSNIGGLYFRGSAATTPGVRVQSNQSQPVRFYSNGLDRMIVEGSGNVFIAKSASDVDGVVGHEFHPNGRAWHTTNDATRYCTVNSIIGGTTGAIYTDFRLGATRIGWITQNGTTGVLYGTGSDYRLKDELGPVAEPLERLKRLRPIHFAWKADGEEQDGFFAHEVAEVVPDAVNGEKDAVAPASDDPAAPAEGTIMPQGLDNGRLVPLLVAAVQALSAKVDDLTARLEAVGA